jgi:hypothetical protein
MIKKKILTVIHGGHHVFVFFFHAIELHGIINDFVVVWAIIFDP